MRVEKYQVKKILNISKHIDGGWFWTKYSAHPYIGCQYGCRYCYYWGTKYSPYKDDYESFATHIKVKENVAELLAKELKKVPVDIINIGDWQPVELKYHLSRKMLQVCYELGFPVFLLEKSPLVVNDLDLIKKIDEKSGVIAGFSIITARDDRTRMIFEPNTPSVKSRFSAMKKLAQVGIMTGTVMMPILPFIYDDENNIEAVTKMTKEAGGQFILAAGLTLEQGSVLRQKYWQLIEENFPERLANSKTIFQGDEGQELYGPRAEHWLKIQAIVNKYCKKYGILNYIPRLMKFWPQGLQLNKEIAAKFYLKAKAYQFKKGKNRYRQWAYLKAAWAIDDLVESLADIYKRSWLRGLEKIPAIGNRLAHDIENELKLRGIKK